METGAPGEGGVHDDKSPDRGPLDRINSGSQSAESRTDDEVVSELDSEETMKPTRDSPPADEDNLQHDDNGNKTHRNTNNSNGDYQRRLGEVETESNMPLQKESAHVDDTTKNKHQQPEDGHRESTPDDGKSSKGHLNDSRRQDSSESIPNKIPLGVRRSSSQGSVVTSPSVPNSIPRGIRSNSQDSVASHIPKGLKNSSQNSSPKGGRRGSQGANRDSPNSRKNHSFSDARSNFTGKSTLSRHSWVWQMPLMKQKYRYFDNFQWVQQWWKFDQMITLPFPCFLSCLYTWLIIVTRWFLNCLPDLLMPSLDIWTHLAHWGRDKWSPFSWRTF